MLASRRAGGHGTLPVLVTAHGVFAGSEWIVRYADLHLDPSDRLFTGDPEVEALVAPARRRRSAPTAGA